MAGIAKSATTPAHLTTMTVRSHCLDQASTVGLSKKLWSPQQITWQATQPVQQTSRMSSTAKVANHPCHVPEPNGAKESPCRFFKPDRKTVVPNCSAFGVYWKFLFDPLSMQESLRCPAQPETWQGQRSNTAHTTRLQIRWAPTKQSAIGTCKIPMNPIKAWSQISILSWLRDQLALNCDCFTV